MQTSMTFAALFAFLCSANAMNVVRERTTRQLHKSSAHAGVRLWTEEEDPFRRLQTAEESMSMSMATESSMSLPEIEEIPVDEADRDAVESGAMAIGTTVSALAAAGAMMFL